jgi:hypothetical protein
MTDIEYMTQLRSKASKELERVRTLWRILPPVYLQWIANRAVALEGLIREYDATLAQLESDEGQFP